MDEKETRPQREANERDNEPETGAETKVVKPLTRAELGLLIGVPAVLILVLALLALRDQGKSTPAELQPPTPGLHITDMVFEPGSKPRTYRAVVITFGENIQSDTVNASTLYVINKANGEILKPTAVTLLSPTKARAEFPNVIWPVSEFQIQIKPSGSPAAPPASGAAPAGETISPPASGSASPASSSGGKSSAHAPLGGS